MKEQHFTENAYFHKLNQKLPQNLRTLPLIPVTATSRREKSTVLSEQQVAESLHLQ
jgi:hypothetical protein